VTLLGERAARLPAGPSNPGCNAGMSFIALRDSAPLPHGSGARRFITERFAELAEAAALLEVGGDVRAIDASRQLRALADKAQRDFASISDPALPPTRTETPPAFPATSVPTPMVVGGVEEIEGADMTLLYEGKKCIHSRFCVTGAPKVFLANVKGPWIYPDAMPVDALVEIAHACPSGAIRYRRKDGKPEEGAPPVNLVSIREAGPYAVRADMRLDGQAVGFRATLCRCGASRNKPYCDGSHHEVGFSASGEPPTAAADMLPVRDGVLQIDPLTDGPLQVRGNLEITSGTGRVVSRVINTRLCRCGGSKTKPFCDGTHATIGFKST
jgi:CDGSH-type Zn-finger protein/uncharacterized Fe-S cluster protein YjdI